MMLIYSFASLRRMKDSMPELHDHFLRVSQKFCQSVGLFYLGLSCGSPCKRWVGHDAMFVSEVLLFQDIPTCKAFHYVDWSKW